MSVPKIEAPPADMVIHPANSAGRFRNGNWIDILFCFTLIVAGSFYLWDAPRWGIFVGKAQYGDAEFWWNGALHFSQGIIAENPNFNYRMGYAAFGGVITAVFGPDYLIFHKILLFIFLLIVCWFYFHARHYSGRIVALFSAVSLIFNPYTAEWLAISTSDGLGMILNLAALLALISGVRGELRLRWIALFGLLLSCGSLTRPLMTPFIVPAMLTVVAAAWGHWRRIAVTLCVMLSTFILPTVGWMTLMAATTGNFALTGESQDSSAFYAASDPSIQVWSGDMYAAVRTSARQRLNVDSPTPAQINAEFWTLTRENYRQHMSYHLERFWRHAVVIARFHPGHSAKATHASRAGRTLAIWSLVGILAAGALWRRRWAGAVLVVALGSIWAVWPPAQAWLGLFVVTSGMFVFIFGNRIAFLWASYWMIGLIALYLTGGTWGPPRGSVQDLNALGYRLGFQVFYITDFLLIGALGLISRWHPCSSVASATQGWFNRDSPSAMRLMRIFSIIVASLFGLLMVSGSGIVAWRMFARARIPPVAYPDISSLSGEFIGRDTLATQNRTELMVNINEHKGARLLTTAMSSGFIWNMPDQQRCMLLLYQQEMTRPIRMHPYRFDVEISRHLPEREWMGRQGAWVLRSFPNTAQNSNLPYYFEMPAVQAFIPLARDGQSYEVGQAVVFPLAKSATQLVASGELVINGGTPEWAMNSGTQQFPRRFALRATEADQAIELLLDLSRTRGRRSFRFGVQLESAGDEAAREAPVRLRLTANRPAGTTTLWEGDLGRSTMPLPVEPALTDATRLRFTARNLLSTDTLWFYELVMTADDFTQ